MPPSTDERKMSTTNASILPSAPLDLQPSAGELLEAARLAAGLAIEEVAVSLQMSAREVAALERGRYHELAEPVFVRGYLRAYAHLLNIPASPVLEAFDQRPWTPSEEAPRNTTRLPRETHDRGRSLRIVAVVGAALLAMAGLWGWYANDGLPAAASQWLRSGGERPETVDDGASSGLANHSFGSLQTAQPPADPASLD
jgi:cytoskeleton protein RodZ